VNQAVASLHAGFEALYSQTWRPLILQEYPLGATVFQMIYSVRSERLLVEQI
jgi:hypothetical protein